MLRNRRGATSLRWLRALLDHGVEVHGQVVVCPGVNDGAVLDDTMVGVLDRFPELAIARRRAARREPLQHRARDAAAHREPRRPPSSTASRTGRTCSAPCSGAGSCFAADEYYLLAGRPFPTADAYEGFPMHEDGIGMARTFELEFARPRRARSPASGPASSPGPTPTPRPATSPTAAIRTRPRASIGQLPAAPPSARPVARRSPATVRRRRRARRRRLIGPLVGHSTATTSGCVPVENRFFGGNVGVTGLLVGEDLARVLAERARPATATCCPTCACPRAGSSTAPRPRTCPVPSRSCPPTASPCAPPWCGTRERVRGRATISTCARSPSSPSSAGRTSASRRS